MFKCRFGRRRVFFVTPFDFLDADWSPGSSIRSAKKKKIISCLEPPPPPTLSQSWRSKKILKNAKFPYWVHLRAPVDTRAGRVRPIPKVHRSFGVGPGLKMGAEKLLPTLTVQHHSQSSQQGTDRTDTKICDLRTDTITWTDWLRLLHVMRDTDPTVWSTPLKRLLVLYCRTNGIPHGTHLHPRIVQGSVVRPCHLDHELFHLARKPNRCLGDVSPFRHLRTNGATKIS